MSLIYNLFMIFVSAKILIANKTFSNVICNRMIISKIKGR